MAFKDTDDILYFPSHLMDPKDKDENWHLSYCKAAYQQFKSNREFFTYNRRKDWIENRKYAEGNQDTNKYKQWMTQVQDDDGNKVGFMDLDWSILSIIPKYRDVVLSYLEKTELEIDVTNLNPVASDERETFKHRLWSIKQLQNHFRKMEGLAETELGSPSVPFLPETQEELELFMNNSFKLNDEIAMELGLEGISYKNNWFEMSKQVREDLFDNGIGACKCYVDARTGEIKYDYVDPVNLVIQSSRNKQFKGVERIGHVVTKTIAQLKLETGDQFNEEQWMEIANLWGGRNGNPTRTFGIDADYVNTDDYDYEYDSYTVNVLELFWYSINSLKLERQEKHGDEFIYMKDYSDKVKKDSKEQRVDVQVVHQCHWILHTDYVYNWGILNDMSRYADNLKECMLPIHVYRLSNKSHLERMIPLADAIQLTWLKIQNAKAKAAPHGFKVELGALENISIDGMGDLTPLQVLEIYNQTGKMIYKSNSTFEDDGEGTSATDHKVIEELQGGMGSTFQELIADLNNSIQMLQEVSGVNDIIAASTPNPKQPVGTSKMAVQATHNTLYPLVSGFMSLKEDISKDALEKLKLQTRYNDEVKYNYKALGSSLLKTIKISSDYSNNFYGLKVQRRASEEQRQHILNAAMQALNQRSKTGSGGIEYGDYLTITRLAESGNLKLCEALLNYRIQKRRKLDEEAAQSNAANQSKLIKDQLEKKKKDAIDIADYNHKKQIEIEDKKKDNLIQVDNNRSKNKIKELEAQSKNKISENRSESAKPV